MFENGLSLYGGLFHITFVSYNFHIFIMLVSCLIIGLICFYSRKVYSNKYSMLDKLLSIRLSYKKLTAIINKMSEQFRITEYSLILLFIITGGIFLMSSSDLVSIFLSIELQSYGLYLISTIYRNSESATAGGLTYFLLGGLSSCFILLSTSLLYANSGTSNLDNLYVITSISEINYNNIIFWYESYYIQISLIAMAVGFLFKVSAAPFHFWSPDVYDGIPTIVTTFVAIVAKISIFIFLLQLIYFTNKSIFTACITSYKGSYTMQDNNWTITLIISSLLSLVIGSVLGLTQGRIKRLYAYSTISHVGFILLALSIQSIESVQSFLFYLIQYSISNLNAFILLLAIGYTFYLYTNKNKQYENLKDKNNSPIQLISQLKGYFYLNPILALSLAITLFSFIGIPPLVGFFAKQMILISALDNGYVFMALIAILTSVISASYYLVIIKQIFFDENENEVILPLKKDKFNLAGSNLMLCNKKDKIGNYLGHIEFSYNNIVLSSYLSISISILTLCLTIFIFMHKPLLNLCYIIALSMFYT